MSDDPFLKAPEGPAARGGIPAESATFANGESLRPDRDPLLSQVLPSSGRPLDEVRFEGYEILEEIGRGGMGVVYRARQQELRREVAIKRVNAASPSLRAKFLAESRVSGQLDHPGIVPVYDLLVTPRGDAALVMKLVRGTSWRDLLHPADEAARRDLDFHLGVLMSVANAVAFAHDKGLSHNDLKPANVMVGEFGEVLVVDWGLSVDMRDPPAEGAVAPHKSTLRAPSGTPAYWAPELAKGKGRAISPATDVYLLGAILCEIVTGRPPHRGSDLLSSILAATRGPPPDLGAGVPPGLSEICRKAMAPEPRDRYPTVAAFQEALRSFLKNRESMLITEGARTTLERASAPPEGAGSADRLHVYAALGEAAASFKQALLLWPENDAAREGARRASLALARLALRNGDLGLAELHVARLDAADAEARELSASVEAATADRRRAARNARLLRQSLAAALGVIVLGLTAGIVMIRAARERTEASRALVAAQLADIRRLADVKRLAEYTAEAETLWPALPDRVEAMEAWLSKARTLAGHLDADRAYLEELRRRAVEARPSYRFASAEEQWEHDTFAALVAGLEVFGTTAIPEMERRIAFARSVRRRTLEEPREAWERAMASIADARACPAYQGLEVTPQLGLIPLGRDPASGLWEFAHLASGEAPARGPDGKLTLTEASGVVLVLLPGGRFFMGDRPPDKDHPAGSPDVDEASRKPEQPVHEVTLAPFFMGKYELTQGQWLRAAGSNPSAYPAGVVIGGRRHTLLHPVEQIGWEEANRVFGRLGLGFATEAQWEYAARAGTTSVYATGEKKESLQGAANLADRYCQENGGPGSWPFELWLDDGYVVHAPVGSYRPNAFGLHDMAGNVWEFVKDHYGGYDLPVSPGDGERQVPGDTPRVFRGGGFRSNAVHARSADRYSLYAPDFRGFDVGVRAARALE